MSDGSSGGVAQARALALLQVEQACRPDPVVLAVSFHPTLPTVALAVQAQVLVFSVQASALVASVSADTLIFHLTFIPAAGVLAGVSGNGDVYLWSLATWQLQNRFVCSRRTEEARKPVACVAAFTFSGLMCVSREGSKYVSVCDASIIPPSLPYLTRIAAKRPVGALACHPRKAVLATGSSDGIVRLWDPSTGALRVALDEVADRERDAKSKASSSTSASKHIPLRFPISSLAFAPTSERLLVGNAGGRVTLWDVSRAAAGIVLAGVETALSAPEPMLARIVSMHVFRSDNSVITAVNQAGAVHAWTVAGGKFHRCSSRTTSAHEMVARAAYPHLSTEERRASLPAWRTHSMPAHPSQDVFAFVQTVPGDARHHPRKRVPITLPVFSMYGDRSSLPIVAPISLPTREYAPPDPAAMLTYPELTYFLDHHIIFAWSFLHNECIEISKTPPDTHAMTPLLMRYSQRSRHFLITFAAPASHASRRRKSRSAASAASHTVVLIAETEVKPPRTHPARAAAFLADTGFYLVLSCDGMQVTKHRISPGLTGDEKPVSTELEQAVDNVWATPLDGGGRVVYLTRDDPQQLVLSVGHEDKRLGLLRYTLPPFAGTSVLDVQWLDPADALGRAVAACVCSERVVFLDASLRPLAVYQAPARVHSALWVGASLLVTTSQQVVAVASDGCASVLAALDAPRTVLAAVLNDRLVYASPGAAQSPVIRNHPVGLLEPLILGTLALHAALGKSHEDTDAALQALAREYDARRVSVSLIHRLARQGHSAAALALSRLHEQHVSACMMLQLARRACDFEAGIAVAAEQFGGSGAAASASSSRVSDVRREVRLLARDAVRHGQLGVAQRCFELLDAAWDLLRLYLVVGNEAGVEALAKTYAKSHPDVAAAAAVYLATLPPGTVPQHRPLINAPIARSGGGSASPSAWQATLEPVPAAAQRMRVDLGRPADHDDDVIFPLHLSHTSQWQAPSLQHSDASARAGAGAAGRTDGSAGGDEDDGALVELAGNGQVAAGSGMGDAAMSAGSAAGDEPDGDGTDDDDDDDDEPEESEAQRQMREQFQRSLQGKAAVSDSDSDDDGGGNGSDADDTGTPKSKLTFTIRDTASVLSDPGSASPGSLRLNFTIPDAAGSVPSPPDVPALSRVSRTLPRHSRISTTATAGTGSDGASIGTSASSPGSESGISTGTTGAPGGSNLSVAMRRRRQRMQSATISAASTSLPPVREAGARPALAAGMFQPPSGTAQSLPTAVTAASSAAATPATSSAGTPAGADSVSVRSSSSSSTTASTGTGTASATPEPANPTAAAASAALSLAATSATAKPTAGGDAALVANAGSLLTAAMGLFEAGRFDDALAKVEQAIEALATCSSPPQQAQPMRICVAYRLALRILIETHRAGSAADPARIALLSAVLAGLPLQPRHRAICTQLAIGKNLLASNFGLAAKLIDMLIGSVPPDKKAFLAAKLEGCREREFVNKALPEHTCLACGKATLIALPRCEHCKHPLRFDHAKLCVISSSPFIGCTVCLATLVDKVDACPGCGMSMYLQPVAR